jgi:hypothetical protein
VWNHEWSRGESNPRPLECHPIGIPSREVTPAHKWREHQGRLLRCSHQLWPLVAGECAENPQSRASGRADSEPPLPSPWRVPAAACGGVVALPPVREAENPGWCSVVPEKRRADRRAGQTGGRGEQTAAAADGAIDALVLSEVRRGTAAHRGSTSDKGAYVNLHRRGRL